MLNTQHTEGIMETNSENNFYQKRDSFDSPLPRKYKILEFLALPAGLVTLLIGYYNINSSVYHTCLWLTLILLYIIAYQNFKRFYKWITTFSWYKLVSKFIVRGSFALALTFSAILTKHLIHAVISNESLHYPATVAIMNGIFFIPFWLFLIGIFAGGFSILAMGGTIMARSLSLLLPMKIKTKIENFPDIGLASFLSFFLIFGLLLAITYPLTKREDSFLRAVQFFAYHLDHYSTSSKRCKNEVKPGQNIAYIGTSQLSVASYDSKTKEYRFDIQPCKKD